MNWDSLLGEFCYRFGRFAQKKKKGIRFLMLAVASRESEEGSGPGEKTTDATLNNTNVKISLTCGSSNNNPNSFHIFLAGSMVA